MPKRYRRKKRQAQLKRIQKDLKSHEKIISKKDETFYLTADERYRVIMEFTENGLARITVSYEIEIDQDWITVKLYDNTHSKNQLHRHTKTSISDPVDIIGTDSVIKKGTPSDWLNWARRDILNRGYYYKQAFLKRSKLVDKS